MLPLPRRANRLPRSPMLYVGVWKSLGEKSGWGRCAARNQYAVRQARPKMSIRRTTACRRLSSERPSSDKEIAAIPSDRRPNPAASNGATSGATIGHVEERGQAPDEPDRDIDQEDPMPGGHLHEPPSERRSDEWPDEAGNGDEAHRLKQLLARKGSQYGKAPDGQQHGSARALQDASGDELRQATRGSTAERSHHEENDRAQEGAPRTEAVGDPAGGRDQHGHGECIRDHDRLHAQGFLAQARSHGGKRRVDDRGIEGLHEEADRDEPQEQIE